MNWWSEFNLTEGYKSSNIGYLSFELLQIKVLLNFSLDQFLLCSVTQIECFRL